MRLSEYQIETIRKETVKAFGPRAVVRLFGSRVDDTRRGGDIDLHIETELPSGEAHRAADRLYVALIRKLGDQQIDIIIHTIGTPVRTIDQMATRTGKVL